MSLPNTAVVVAAIALFSICVWVVTLSCPKWQNIVMSNVQVNLVRHYLDMKIANTSRKITTIKKDERNGLSSSGSLERTPLLVPKYMLELYKQSKRGSRSNNGPDIVKGVTPTSKAVVFAEDADDYSMYMKKEQLLLVFEVPPTNTGEILKGAELRILVNTGSRENPKDERQEHLFLEVLWVKESTEEIQNLDSCYLFQNKDEWILCNITRAFQQEDIKVLTLLVKLEEGVDIHLKCEHSIGSDEPLLILSYDTEKITPESPKRIKRSVEEYEEESNKVWDNDNFVHGIPAQRSKRVKNTCRRRPLYVDFSQINYDTWIVAPEGYEAFQCAGKCFFPVSEHLSPTKHAIIQTLLHSVTPEKVPRACCVPTRLEPISLLYVDQHGVLTYRFSYEDMVVAECGCR